MAIRQDLQDAKDIGTGAAGGELAVTERAGSPFAEEVVALGVERPVLVEPADVGDPILDGPAPLEDQWPESRFGQEVSGEQAGRTRADDHRPMPERSRARLGPVEPLGPVKLNVRGRAGLDPWSGSLLEPDLGRIGEMEVVVTASVEALAEDPPARDRVGT